VCSSCDEAPLLSMAQSLLTHLTQDKRFLCQVLPSIADPPRMQMGNFVRIPISAAGGFICPLQPCLVAADPRGPPSLYIASEHLSLDFIQKSHHPSAILVRHEYEPPLRLFTSKTSLQLRRPPRQLDVPKRGMLVTDLDRLPNIDI
jgi:hypothetical protein